MRASIAFRGLSKKIPLFLICAIYVTSAQTISQINLNHREFADALTAELYQDENECTSAWGVSMAFGLVYPASIGESSSQIQSIFHYPTGSQLQLVWQDTSNRIDNAYQGECLDAAFGDGECTLEAPTLEIANRIWIDTRSILNSTYVSVVGDLVQRTDFFDAGAGAVINDWVNDTTHGLVDSILPDGPLSDYLLIAINSIYLKASWLNQFHNQLTNEDVFYTTASRTTPLTSPSQFMHTVEFFPYSHEALPGFQMIQMPFVAGDLSMIFVLPTGDHSETASSTSVLQTLPQLERTRVALALPKFKYESTYQDDLKSSLQALGLVAPFLGELCLLEGDCSSYVDLVIQKTAIDVNEKGVEAAAVSVVASPRSLPRARPILVMMDHPFQFFIYDSQEELVLFEGRVGAPPIPSGAPAAPLQAVHADTDFWLGNFGVDPEVPIFDVVLPTDSPTTAEPTTSPTPEPTVEPTAEPTLGPTPLPTLEPTVEPTAEPTLGPTPLPTLEPTHPPTLEPTPETTMERQEDVAPIDAPMTTPAPSTSQSLPEEVADPPISSSARVSRSRGIFLVLCATAGWIVLFNLLF